MRSTLVREWSRKWELGSDLALLHFHLEPLAFRSATRPNSLGRHFRISAFARSFLSLSIGASLPLRPSWDTASPFHISGTVRGRARAHQDRYSAAYRDNRAVKLGLLVCATERLVPRFIPCPRYGDGEELCHQSRAPIAQQSFILRDERAVAIARCKYQPVAHYQQPTQTLSHGVVLDSASTPQ